MECRLCYAAFWLQELVIIRLECPTKLFLDPREMFEESGNRGFLSFVRLLRSPDDVACQRVSVGPSCVLAVVLTATDWT